MSGLENTAKRMFNVGRGKGYQTNKERRAKGAAKRQQALDAVYAGAQIPDEEEVRRKERRKSARRRGSRAETILTDQLGG